MRWNLKEAGCQRKKCWRANSRTDEQKSHSRPYRDGRVCTTTQSPMLPESRAVNVAVTWEESCCAYPGRSCRREVGESESRSNNELQEVSRSHGTVCRRHRGVCQEQASGGASDGIEPKVSGGKAETENEHGEEQSDQHLRSEGVQVSWILHGKEWKWHLHPCAPKVTEQGKGKAETTDKAQPRMECPPSDAGSECVYPWMAWILPFS